MLTIGTRAIGPEYPPYIIAEMSANHNGSLERALALVEAAAWAECDAIKVQLYDPLRLATARGGADKKLTKGIWAGRTLLDIYTQGVFHYDWLPIVADYAKEYNITLFASVFDEVAITLSEMNNLPAIKISSFDCTNLTLIEAAANTHRPLLISTGMASIEEAAMAIGKANLVTRAGVLHCVSQYPCPIDKANLGRIEELRYYLQCPVGFSDHTLGYEASIAAVARGACMIEKHLTLKRDEGGLDAPFSLEPDEMAQLAQSCRFAWRACQPNEEAETELKELRVRA